MSVCLSEGYNTCFGWRSEMPRGRAVLWKHELWIITHHKRKKHTSRCSLYLLIPPCCCVSTFLVFSTFLLCLSAHLARPDSEGPWCVRTFVTVGEESKHNHYCRCLKLCLSVWLNGWWQSISCQLSGSDTGAEDQSPICDEQSGRCAPLHKESSLWNYRGASFRDFMQHGIQTLHFHSVIKAFLMFNFHTIKIYTKT